ncbi:hypothetical protein Rin_00019220, partial [Candidatus Regiella insecticola 5.15]
SDAIFFAMGLHPAQNDLEHHYFLLLTQIINHQQGLTCVKYSTVFIECVGKIVMGAWEKK